jgi:hypothetical protein
LKVKEVKIKHLTSPFKNGSSPLLGSKMFAIIDPGTRGWGKIIKYMLSAYRERDWEKM